MAVLGSHRDYMEVVLKANLGSWALPRRGGGVRPQLSVARGAVSILIGVMPAPRQGGGLPAAVGGMCGGSLVLFAEVALRGGSGSLRLGTARGGYFLVQVIPEGGGLKWRVLEVCNPPLYYEIRSIRPSFG